jgi:thiol-disulfide isomerase/thioredoxin
MKRYLCLLALLCPILRLCANSNPTRIGDKVPSIVVSGIVNAPDHTLNLAALKGKVVIIDFWATNCGSCINAMPRLERLQKRFGDSVVILPVSYEKAEIVQSFLVRNAIGKTMHMPVVTADTKLAALFPHQLLSHEVWIDQKGIVRAITEAEYVNLGNISTLLHGRSFRLPVKEDFSFNYNKPLLDVGSAIFYSGVTAFKPGVAPKVGVDVDSASKSKRFYIVNFPVFQLYKLATGHLSYFPKTLIDIKVKDSSRLVLPAGAYLNDWKPKGYTCYEAALPMALPEKAMLSGLLADLNKFFGYRGGMVRREAPCLSLELLAADSSHFASAGGKPTNTLHAKYGVKTIVNASLSNIVWELNDLPGGLAAVDNTGFKGRADLRLQISSFADLDSLNLALKSYGLVVRKRVQALDFLVIRDAD